MNLVVDIGNTRCKAAVMEHGSVRASCCAEHPDAEALLRLAAPWPVERAIVSSTRGGQPELLRALRRRIACVVEFTPETPVPLKNDYLTPATLGRDRLAAAVGAAALYPGRNVLVVDFGTAVTFDLVSADATFRGGCISPGLSLRFKALHDYTARLPLAEPCEGECLAGRTTDEAVRHGVMNSLSFETEGYIARVRAQWGDVCVIFTGGDAKFFAKRIKNTIFADCNLVFVGLDRILEAYST